MDDKSNPPAAGAEEASAYIADMIEQLAQMADAIGNRRLATALRETLDAEVVQSISLIARRDA